MALDYGMPNFANSVMQGVQLGMLPGQISAQQQAQQAAQQAQAQKLAQQQQLQERMMALTRNPSPTLSDYQSVIPLLPKEQGELMLKTWDASTKERQQGMLSMAGQVMSALRVNPELGIKILQEQEENAKAAGDAASAQALSTWRRIAEIRPQESAASIGLLIAQLPGGDKLIQGMETLGKERRADEMQPAALTKAQADAETAAVRAKFAESDAVIDLQKKGWDIKKIQADMQIARQNAAIAAANVSASREGNSLKRQELDLKVQDMINKRDATVRERVAEAESAKANIDNFLNTADQVLATPMGVVGSAAGPISARMPTLTQGTADFEALIEALGNQVTMSRIGEMKGVLSDSDLKVLRGSLQNLDLKQSPEQLMKNVREAQRLMLKARKTAAAKFGIPETVPDTPAAAASPDDIEALLKKYGGQ